jgi:hypothetical protein
MENKLYKDLEEMYKAAAVFIDYYYKMVEIFKNIEGNQRVILFAKLKK